jgi:hypothetical protein
MSFSSAANSRRCASSCIDAIDSPYPDFPNLDSYERNVAAYRAALISGGR